MWGWGAAVRNPAQDQVIKKGAKMMLDKLDHLLAGGEKTTYKSCWAFRTLT